MGLSMNRFFRIASAGLLTMLVGATTAAADEFLGSYVARISEQDHQASDGYPLDTAGQMVTAATIIGNAPTFGTRANAVATAYQAAAALIL